MPQIHVVAAEGHKSDFRIGINLSWTSNWMPWRTVGWDWTGWRKVLVLGGVWKGVSLVSSLLKLLPLQWGMCEIHPEVKARQDQEGQNVNPRLYFLCRYTEFFSENFWSKVMLIHAPVVDLPVCFQAVCDQRKIFPSHLCCQTGRQAGVRLGGWLISKCQFAFNCLSPPPLF